MAKATEAELLQAVRKHHCGGGIEFYPAKRERRAVSSLLHQDCLKRVTPYPETPGYRLTGIGIARLDELEEAL